MRGTHLAKSWELLPGDKSLFEERFDVDAETQIGIRLELARMGIPVTPAAIRRDAEPE